MQDWMVSRDMGLMRYKSNTHILWTGSQGRAVSRNIRLIKHKVNTYNLWRRSQFKMGK